MTGLLFMMIICFVMISPLAVAWFNGGYWWLFILTPLAFVLMVTAVTCFIRK
jgi:Na+-transporting NADH:ubiquinone oxidoreductase subunit NqrB